MRSWRLVRTTGEVYQIEYKWWLFPFVWWYEGFEVSENKARERVVLLKQKPIYL